MMIKIISLILIGQIWSMAGQVLFKKSVNAFEPPDMKRLGSYLDFTKRVLGKWYVWIGFSLIGIGVIFWLSALAQTDLSIAFPIDSLQYIVALIFCRIFLGEHIDKMKLTGTLLIIAGIIIVAIS